MGTVLLIILVVLMLGAMPQWDHHSYGYAPSAFASVLVLILVLFLLTGRH